MTEIAETIDTALREGAPDLTDGQRGHLIRHLMKMTELPTDRKITFSWGTAVIFSIVTFPFIIRAIDQSPPFYESTDAQLIAQLVATPLSLLLGGLIPAGIKKAIQNRMPDKREGDIRDFLASEGII